MKKHISEILVFPLILSLAINFCCCLGEVSAQTTQQPEHCHDQSGKADHSHSKDSHDCMCQKVADFDSNQLFDAELALTCFYKDFFKNGMMLVCFFEHPLANQTSLLSDRSPPKLAATFIPIYLKISILRI